MSTSMHHPAPTHIARAISENAFVGPQLDRSNIVDLSGLGIQRVICNRPDGEEAGQPSAAALADAAAAAGLEFHHVPFSGMPNTEAVAAVEALIRDGRPTLLFCRSGMRSAVVWASAEVGAGRLTAEEARARAGAAGYDLSRLPL